MLSNAAWNAFLKTLEEPPPHVKFIFATTEVHKVPVTILSRCQRYDFKLDQRAADRARACGTCSTQEKLAADDAAVHDPRARGRGQHARRDEPARSGHRLGRRERRQAHRRGRGARARRRRSRGAPPSSPSALVAGDARRAACASSASSRAQGFDLAARRARPPRAPARPRGRARSRRRAGAQLLDLADEEVADVKALAASADADDLISATVRSYRCGFSMRLLRFPIRTPGTKRASMQWSPRHSSVLFSMTFVGTAPSAVCHEERYPGI